MGVVILLCLAPSAAAVTVGVLRARSRTRHERHLPAPYVRHRPDRHRAVAVAETVVRDAYGDLAALYDTPTPFGPPAR
ncbi:hypothetical protein ACIOEZ_34145 [Streptomyces sp. NPDC087866]|uniref:hypothetical protein n=1 Tax=Streptomyces sp. NPDC087866 TaxID=3365815 RepID=UPI0038002907